MNVSHLYLGATVFADTGNNVQDTAYWDCVTRSEFLNPDAVDFRHAITSTAQSHDWDKLLSLLMSWRGKDLVNAVHLDDSTFDTPLHEAARGGAPEHIVLKFLELKAFRTMRNAQGQRPMDIARAAGQTHLYTLLEPTLREVSLESLLPVQQYFHDLIRLRAQHRVSNNFPPLRLPELEPLLETNIKRIWCRIPGMYGGFEYWLGEGYDTLTLVTYSFIRIVGGSEQHHEIDVNGFRRVALKPLEI